MKRLGKERTRKKKGRKYVKKTRMKEDEKITHRGKKREIKEDMGRKTEKNEN